MQRQPALQRRSRVRACIRHARTDGLRLRRPPSQHVCCNLLPREKHDHGSCHFSINEHLQQDQQQSVNSQQMTRARSLIIYNISFLCESGCLQCLSAVPIARSQPSWSSHNESSPDLHKVTKDKPQRQNQSVIHTPYSWAEEHYKYFQTADCTKELYRT